VCTVSGEVHKGSAMAHNKANGSSLTISRICESISCR
jgi:hypothetical protein